MALKHFLTIILSKKYWVGQKVRLFFFCKMALVVLSCLSFFKKKLFIYLFLAALGLRCCAWAFSSCGEWGLLLVAVCGLLLAVASFVVEHRL